MLPEHWTVDDSVYEPREDSFLLQDTLERCNLDGKTVLDVGTGSGLQAYTALDQGAARVLAVDVSQAALENVAENIPETYSERIETTESDLFEAVDDRFDIVVFNAPYVPSNRELNTMEERAWAGGDEGRDVIDRFIAQAGDYVAEDGTVLLLQSSLNGIPETVDRFADRGFEAEVVAEKKISWERLVVIRAKRE